ncbi:unnamed protein product [Rhizophagus irregularis]|nr:unnamed protein product [Rhizophagus irregularis]
MTEVEGTHDNSDTEIEQPNQKKIKLNERRGGSKVRSWIWKYFEPNFKEGVRYAVCKVEVVVGKECGKTYKIGTSTSNCSDHLANIHGITQEQEEANVNQNQNIKDVFSKVTYHQESRQLELCQHLTDWVICDSQPLTVLESPAFKQLIFQLDPKFQIPNPKYIKLLIHKAYNYSKPLIMEKLENDANAQSKRLEKIQKQFIQPNSNSSSRTPIDARKTSNI